MRPSGEKAFARFIRWIEGGVTASDHENTVSRLTVEIERYVSANTSVGSANQQALICCINRIVHPGETASAQWDPREHQHTIWKLIRDRLAHLDGDGNDIDSMGHIVMHGLEDGVVGLNIDSDRVHSLRPNVEALLERSSWSGSASEVEAARRASRMLYVTLRLGVLDSNYVAAAVLRILKTLTPAEWFISGKLIYGLSYVFRSLLIVCGAKHQEVLGRYLETVRELLLRNIEIKRGLVFFGETRERSMHSILERLRYSIAMFDVAALFGDLRFLNAGLKENDRLFKYVSKTKISSQSTSKNHWNIMIAVHYIKAVSMQEEQYRRLQCRT